MTTESQEKVDDIIVNEEQDGSVTVENIELPEETPAEGEKTVEQKQEAVSEAVPEDGGEDHPDDTEAIRQARREKRRLKKQLARQNQLEKDYKLQQVMRQNQAMAERIAQLEKRTHGSELARIDKAIEDQQVRIQWAKMKIAEATENKDGSAMSEAQELLYEARRAAESLEALKRQAAAAQAPREQPIAPDVRVQKLAAQWMERNPWYTPGGEDEDSEIAMTIDRRMAKEGWQPSDPEYWEELDSRLRKRLPHRFDGSTDEEEPHRQPQSRPRSVVTSGARESVAPKGKNTFTITAEQKKAMMDAGMWDDPELRARMIKRYAMEARNRRNG